MNTAIILFLNEALGNIFLAGLALSIGSFFSMIFDGLFSSLQKVFSSRLLFLSSIIGMIFSVFLFFISLHPVFAFFAAIFFRISFDLCDITAVSYVLAKSLPAEYGKNLSYKQLAQGVGMIGGFIISAILLASAYFIGDTAIAVVNSAGELINKSIQAESFISALFMMKIFLILLLCGLWFFAFLLFDKNVPNLTKEMIVHSFQELKSDTLTNLKHSAISVTKGITQPFQAQQNQIHLHTTEEKNPLNMKEILSELSGAFNDLKMVFQKHPTPLQLIWSMGIMGIFSYWDTFLATFLPIFFTEVLRLQEGWLSQIPGSLLMLVFILPVLAFLPKVAALGDKFGRHHFMVLGLILTAISTLIIGLVDKTSFFWIFIFGFGISFGYLFGMSTAKAQVAEKFNEFIAVEKKTLELDTNVSAGPLMLIDNVGNIIGPLLGGGMIALFGFQGFFIVFSILLFWLIFFSFKNAKAISGFAYVFQSPIKSVEK